MLGYLGLLCLFNLNIILVQCLIPSLSVRKISETLVKQKRKDTLDTCRLFINENKEESRTLRPTVHPPLVRSKRDIDSTFNEPITGAEKQKRIEKIIDKLYDEIQENGTTITYRKPQENSGTTKTSNSKPNRRFDFAPAVMEGPDDAEKPSNYSVSDVVPVRVDWHKQWPKGIIPYFIDAKTYDSYLSDEVIGRAFDYFEKATCIRLQRLRERPTDLVSLSSVQWIYISNPNGIRQCVHSNEIQENAGVQIVVFGYDCMSMGEIVHELMHVLGFSHEHTRPDRDEYVTILWDNIKPGYKKYFEVRAVDQLKSFAYDYSSVLHYPSRAFSKNGQLTILAEPGIKLGQREGLSETDVEKISMIFGEECVIRNKQYLYHTCPIVVSAKIEDEPINKPSDLDEYYKNRIWPFGIINYNIRDKLEFSTEEIANIKAVIAHIERETCVEFRNVNDDLEKADYDDNLYDSPDSPIHDISKDVEDGGNPVNAEIDNTENASDIENVNDDASAQNNDAAKLTHDPKLDIPFYNNSQGVPAMPYNSDLNEVLPQNSPLPARMGTVRSPKKREMKQISKGIGKTNNKTRTKTHRPMTPSRRHAKNFLVLTRTSNANCPCPAAGRPEKNGIIEIGTGCFNSVNDLLHLFVHILGLEHQHNSHDRDSYIKILWDQLSPELTADLKVKLPAAASAGYPYDYNSIMHFPWLEIKTGRTNLMYPIWNDGWVMGHWQGLSPTDVKKINDIYRNECSKRKRAAKS